jgi:hypothetical protein
MPTELCPSVAENDPVLIQVSRPMSVISVYPYDKSFAKMERSTQSRVTMRAGGDGEAAASGMPDCFAPMLAIRVGRGDETLQNLNAERFF